MKGKCNKDKKDRKEQEQTYEEFLRDSETCNYCGNRFDDKYTSHSVCGLA